MNASKTLALTVSALLTFSGGLMAAEQTDQTSPAKNTWHGFDRYDFIMDDETLAITPFAAPAGEGNGIKDPPAGKHRCILVTPKTAAAGHPWTWRGCYWDHQPQTEVELLKRGFCVAYISASASLRPGKEWDAWYEYLTSQRGMSRKPSFIGMSRGGEFSYTWATLHPDKVTCIYADNPGANWGLLTRMAALVTNDVPVLHVCGSFDPLLGRVTLPIESIYEDFGGRFSVMIKEGRGHHPHSLNNPKPIADFIENSVKETAATAPDFAGAQFTRTYYYSDANRYENYPSEHTYITLRGALFSPCYDRYQFDLPHVEGTISVIAPKTPAPGKPWVFRADITSRANEVDQGLLAKGFYIVTGPVPYNADGPQVAHWNLVYSNFTAHGFSAKPVMEGVGGAAGEAYAWAIENPDKISAIYAENPFLHSNLAKVQPLDNLAPLAKAGVPILHICGSDDPWLADNTIAAQKSYEKLGGKMEVVVEKDKGHFPAGPSDPKAAIDFIVHSIQN